MAPGVFSFFSYCDPRSVETLDVFQICMQWAMTGKLSVKDVEEAKLEVFLKVQLFTNRYNGVKIYIFSHRVLLAHFFFSLELNGWLTEIPSASVRVCLQ